MVPRFTIYVEEDFQRRHVGVRQVILLAIRQLCEAGAAVSAVACKSLTVMELPHHELGPVDGGNDRSIKTGTATRLKDVQTWHTLPESAYEVPTETTPLRHEVAILSTPWLGIPDKQLAGHEVVFGIAYDAVPQMIVKGELTFPGVSVSTAFAFQHNTGYQQYERLCDGVLAISKTTKRDLTKLYGSQFGAKTSVWIPFSGQARFVSPLRGSNTEISKTRAALCVINGLDERKNPRTVVQTAKELAQERSVRLTFVGRERMDGSRRRRLFDQLQSAGIELTWRQNASEIEKFRILASCDALLAPSYYEGLGLPVLEAQSLGIPAITSDKGALPEINCNERLIAAPSDYQKLATLVSAICDQENGIISGPRLRQTLAARLENQTSLVEILNRHLLGASCCPPAMTTSGEEPEKLKSRASASADLESARKSPRVSYFRGHYCEWRDRRVDAILKFWGRNWCKGKKVLEVGAGFGDIGAAFAREGADVTCTEVRVEHVREMLRRHPNLKCEVRDLEADDDYPDDDFDLLVHMGVLYHLSDVDRALRSALQVAPRVVLETEVVDSSDPFWVQYKVERGYDQAIHGIGARPSPAFVERIIGEEGRIIEGIVGSECNSGGHRYDWTVSESLTVRDGQRRMWFIGPPPLSRVRGKAASEVADLHELS